MSAFYLKMMFYASGHLEMDTFLIENKPGLKLQ